MFNDCHCVVGLRRRYERVFLMGCGTSSQCACRKKLFSSEYRNVYYLYGSKPRCLNVFGHVVQGHSGKRLQRTAQTI